MAVTCYWRQVFGWRLAAPQDAEKQPSRQPQERDPVACRRPPERSQMLCGRHHEADTKGPIIFSREQDEAPSSSDSKPTHSVSSAEGRRSAGR